MNIYNEIVSPECDVNVESGVFGHNVQCSCSGIDIFHLTGKGGSPHIPLTEIGCVSLQKFIVALFVMLLCNRHIVGCLVYILAVGSLLLGP